MSLAASSRPRLIETLTSTRFDVLVVGGGITGAGILWEAAARGLKAALIELGDFGEGTSSRSSKLIHGGLRYLEQGDIRLVFESVRERQRLMRRAPHLARPLSFVFPVWKGGSRWLMTIDAGLTLYDLLGAFGGVIRHRTYGSTRLLGMEPALHRDKLHGGVIYTDALTDDARLVVANVRAAVKAGALALTRVAFEAPLVCSGEGGERVCGAVVRDVPTGRTFEVSAGCVIVAAGPWTDHVLARFKDHPGAPEGAGQLMRPSKGVHIVLPRSKLPVTRAIVMSAPRDRRVVFALPWEGQTVVGTTDTPFADALEHPEATADDVAYLLETAQAHFDIPPLTPDDVLSTWSGVRPLVAGTRDDAGSTYRTSREHTILVGKGVVAIAGGKLTTYRVMAEQAVSAAAPFLPESGHHPAHLQHTPLPGAEGLPQHKNPLAAVAEQLAASEGIDPALATHLALRYGTEATEVVALGRQEPDGLLPVCEGAPTIWAELRFAAEREMALDLDDLLVRRTHVFFVAPDQGLSAAPEVARRLCAWSQQPENRCAEMLDRYHATVASALRFRSKTAA